MNGRARRTPRYITTHYANRGTRFLVFPQVRSLSAFRTPETIHLAARPGTIQAGPRDAQMSVVDALGKRPYFSDGVQHASPPYRGPRSRRPARPQRGHFDHIRPVPATAREFSAATVYAVIRLTLMVWEHYLGRPVRWYFRRAFPRLEVIPHIISGTAYSRPGYIECGVLRRGRRVTPLCENFDIVSHETGHMILRDVIGHPSQPQSVECRAREEAFADIVSMVTLLHFRKVTTHVLRQTHGNLFSRNVLSNLGELSRTRTIRRAFNDSALSTLDWDPDPDAFKYALAAPLTAAVFDILVDMYEDALVGRGAIRRKLAQASFDSLGREQRDVQRLFDEAYRRRAPRFEEALIEARDRFGFLLARAWRRTSPYDLYPTVARTLVEVGAEMGGRPLARTVRDALRFRDIVPAPA
ncbi:MAG: hypothetical protein DMD78_18595 [Candidatus Rokuibacteriota bacterium]|nr:MAG: hypothetical protein DMD78_18595 [Candidatus Rokubacteria bacterium]